MAAGGAGAARDRPRVAVAIGTRLLADAFAAALEHPDRDVIVLPESLDPAAVDVPFDVVLVAGPLPAGLIGTAIVHLPAVPGQSGRGSVTTASGTEPLEITGVEQLIDLVERLTSGRD